MQKPFDLSQATQQMKSIRRFKRGLTSAAVSFCCLNSKHFGTPKQIQRIELPGHTVVKMFNNLISLFKENGMKLITRQKKSPFWRGGSSKKDFLLCKLDTIKRSRCLISRFCWSVLHCSENRISAISF